MWATSRMDLLMQTCLPRWLIVYRPAQGHQKGPPKTRDRVAVVYMPAFREGWWRGGLLAGAGGGEKPPTGCACRITLSKPNHHHHLTGHEATNASRLSPAQQSTSSLPNPAITNQKPPNTTQAIHHGVHLTRLAEASLALPAAAAVD